MPIKKTNAINWPADKVERHKVAKLIPYARNSRTHSDAQIGQIAASIQEWGFANPVLIAEDGTIIAGHGRVLAAKQLGLAEVPVMVAKGWSEAQRRAFVIADNKLTLNGGWDSDILRAEFGDLDGIGFDLGKLGFDPAELAGIRDVRPAGLTDPDDAPEPPANPVATRGDLWALGRHRLMCGGSTDGRDADVLMAHTKAQLLHADPPYGMGKQADGVANDNLYRDKLDAFQMNWWRAFRPFLVDSASGYIWGNAPDLWRLWYHGGLGGSEKMELRNEIVWDKKSIAGMASDLMTQYPEATERCLFFQFGEQFIGNVNADQYFDGWDEIRLYLKVEAKAAGLTSAKCQEITGVQMYAHWFSKSQWSLISAQHYATLALATGHFRKPYSEIRAIYDRIKGGFRAHINGILGGRRSYFDNAHDIMRDVWEYPRVVGGDRHGHATPKPVAMMERVMLSSLPEGGVVVEPFCGSGSTLMGAEKTGRVCYTMELQPKYCDVTIERWQAFTGETATLDGVPFAEVKAERLKQAA